MTICCVFEHIPTEYDRNVSGEKILKIALDKAGVAEGDIKYIVSTGYGRKSFLRADANIPEIIAHGVGTWHALPARARSSTSAARTARSSPWTTWARRAL